MLTVVPLPHSTACRSPLLYSRFSFCLPERLLEALLWGNGGKLPLASVSDQFLLWVLRLQRWVLLGYVLLPSLHLQIGTALVHSQTVLPSVFLVSVQWLVPAAALVFEVRMMVVAGNYSGGCW